MTSAFEPDPQQQGPKVLVDLIPGGPSAKDLFTPPAVKAAADKEGSTTPGTDNKSDTDKPVTDKPGTDKTGTGEHPGDDKTGAAQHKTDNATPGHDANTGDTEPQTYTSTEPGFPVGQLISGLLAAGIGAGTAAAGAAVAVPGAALSAVMPILQSMISLLGNPSHASGRSPLALPASAPRIGADKFSGAAADKYRENADKVTDEEKPFPEQDKKANDVVDQARDTNIHANATVNKAMSDLHAAAAAAPATGEAAFAGAASRALTAVKNAVSGAAATHQALASQLATNRASSAL
ncbi:hypothetical protein [Mycobacteroides salmoniphilum]|uniref:Uncharacterized protein n=1 Tax=Mycobacteroides salmoniphilum TaxID=404941 RepID=A0A4R8T043_9MYCO|nr:hypothetical protein [Mycobacteroides salmoniphilum]TEA09232.1 hypothetical protein CCUG60884_00222 [Mycobacteroides salmoniphilum]